jgi:hypothetical protein
MATIRKKYWRMGVRYMNARGVQWGQKRFNSVSELMNAVSEWSKQNEDALAELHMRSDYEYFSAPDTPIEASNPAQ